MESSSSGPSSSIADQNLNIEHQDQDTVQEVNVLRQELERLERVTTEFQARETATHAQHKEEVDRLVRHYEDLLQERHVAHSNEVQQLTAELTAAIQQMQWNEQEMAVTLSQEQILGPNQLLVGPNQLLIGPSQGQAMNMHPPPTAIGQPIVRLNQQLQAYIYQLEPGQAMSMWPFQLAPGQGMNMWQFQQAPALNMNTHLDTNLQLAPVPSAPIVPAQPVADSANAAPLPMMREQVSRESLAHPREREHPRERVRSSFRPYLPRGRPPLQRKD